MNRDVAVVWISKAGKRCSQNKESTIFECVAILLTAHTRQNISAENNIYSVRNIITEVTETLFFLSV